MDYTVIPKPDQPEVCSNRPVSVCRIVTNSSSVLVSLCHVLLTSEASSVTGCYMPPCVTQHSLSALAMQYGPVGPSAARQGASLTSPHSPLPCVLCSKDLPKHKHNIHHWGLFTAEECSKSLLVTCLRKRMPTLTKMFFYSCTTTTAEWGKTRISKRVHKQTLQDLTHFSHYGFIRCSCTMKLKVDTMSLFNISVGLLCWPSFGLWPTSALNLQPL